jgi:hypothetical protein
MNSGRLAIRAALIATLTVGCSSAPAATQQATQSPTATVIATATGGPSPAASITTLGIGDESLAAGTYRIDLANAETVRDGESRWPAALLTVPKGWSNLDGWLVHRGGIGSTPVSVQFWSVAQVYGNPCKWQGTLFTPGPTVDDLVKALVARPLRNATKPTAVMVDGNPGKYLEWSVPAGIDFATCDVDQGTHYFESWKGPLDSDRYQQAPGQIDRLWILNISGDRLVIDAFSMPSATSAEIKELLGVVASIRFSR